MTTHLLPPEGAKDSQGGGLLLPRPSLVTVDDDDYYDNVFALSIDSFVLPAATTYEMSTTTPGAILSAATATTTTTTTTTTDTPQADKTLFHCGVCLRSFVKRDSLRKHVYREHRGAPRVSCQAPTCNKSFKSSSEMREHYFRRHAKVRPFRCAQCDRTYALESTLRYHQRRSHPSSTVLLVCSRCAKCFGYASDLRTHLRQKHKLFGSIIVQEQASG